MKPLPDLAEGEELSDPVEVGKALALRRLGRLPQTAAQLREYLQRKGIPEDAALAVVTRMVELKLVDDAEYAAMWVRSRRAVRKSGNSVIRRELQQRGVSAELVESALSSEVADEAALAWDLAWDLGQRKWRSLNRIEEPQRSNRLVSFLVRRGHSLSVAYRVAERLRAEEV